MVASRVSAQEVGPALPSPRPGGPPIAGWWGPRGPGAVPGSHPARLQVRRSRTSGRRCVHTVGTCARRGLAAASRLGRGVRSRSPQRQPRRDVRAGRLLPRTAASNRAETSGAARALQQGPRGSLLRVLLSGESCWSVKRDRGDAILRLATYAPDGISRRCASGTSRGSTTYAYELPLAAGTASGSHTGSRQAGS